MEISHTPHKEAIFSTDQIYVKSHIVTISVKLIGILISLFRRISKFTLNAISCVPIGL